MAFLTQKAAAAELSITTRQLRTWQTESWFPQDARSGAGYDVERIRAARDAMGRKGSARSDQAAALKLATDAEKLKQHRVKTQQLELQLKIRQAELFPRDGFELFFSTFMTSVGDDLDQLPSIVSKMVPTTQRKKLTTLLRQELDDMRRKWRADLEREAKDRGIALGSGLEVGAV